LRTEVAVVGGGPAGLITARELAAQGIRVKVFEEHPKIGTPNHCAGVLSIEGLNRIGVEPNIDFLRHEIKGGTAFAPNGTGIRIMGRKTRAYIVDRTVFDKHLADAARDAGAEIETKHRIRDFIITNGKVVGVRGDLEIEASIVIDAEGVSGALAKKVRLHKPESGILAGINANVPGAQLESDMVEVWLGKKLAEGMFAWAVPNGEDEIRCGLATSKGDALELLRSFIKARFGLSKCEEPTRWPVLTGGPIDKTHGEGILLVGDVAGHTKPTTGGGVILGGMCAIIAAETAIQALEEGDYSASFLRRYDKRWREALGGEFSSMLRMRRFLNSIPDPRMNKIFASVKSAGLEPILEKFIAEGDMDLQSEFLRKALTHPGMLRVLTGTVGHLALEEFKSRFNL
jgi:geranylgeranyl reductase family protein|tara:strand:+ start:5380 stop:6582 length:1203 start_codon:yes stop_codon:yes gene_type:complete